VTHKAVFEGLVFDEQNQPVEVVYVGDDPCYVVNDAGFRRHISAEYVDRQVFKAMVDQIEGHEGIISEQTAKMIGQDDIFSRAMIESQLKNIDQQFSNLQETGLPDDGRAYMGMMGFRITINMHGDVVNLEQPGMIDTDGDED
jgi:hypothetical protein